MDCEYLRSDFVYREDRNGAMFVVNDKLVRKPSSHFLINGKPKIKFNSEYDAVIRCYEMNIRDGQVHKMVTYKCPVCQKWHIGNSHKILTDEERDKIREKYKTIRIKLGK